MQHSWFSNIRPDLTGGLVSATVAIPLAMGYGMFAFVPLGDEYFAYGARAGLYAAFAAGIVSVLLGDKTTTLYAPRVTTTFFLGLLLYHLVHSDAAVIKSSGLALTLVVFFAILLLAGAFQALFGLLRLGTLIKFAPHPVMAGFQNAAALLLFLIQFGNVGGFDKNISFIAAIKQFDQAKPLSVGIAVIAMIAMWVTPKFTKRVPPLLIGLGAGTALYYGFLVFGYGQHLGPTIGVIAPTIVDPAPAPNIAGLTMSGSLFEIWPTIIGGALALAIIASIDALLCAKLVSQPGDPRVTGNALLMRLGIGNMVSAAFGGITSGINIGPSIVNRAFGAKTPVSVLLNVTVICAAFALFFNFIGHLPRVALSAVIMVVAIQHFDQWSLSLTKRLFMPSSAQRGAILLDLLVVILVAVLSIAINIVLAVFIGLAIAVALFIWRMSRSVIRRSYHGDGVHSRKARTAKEMELLEQSGGKILVIELQGALFFGTAETLANTLVKVATPDSRFFVLDFKRVTEIDSTAARIIAEIEADLARNGKILAVVAPRGSENAARLADLAASSKAATPRLFDDIDRGMEWAEDELLRETPAVVTPYSEMALEDVTLLSTLNAAELMNVRQQLVRAVHPKGTVVFQEGDEGRELFIITRGTASVMLKQVGSGDVRLASFAPGTVFGELALLDAGPRSASVIADDELVTYSLSDSGFAAISAKTPGTSIKLLGNLARELSGRLRRANRTIRELEG